MDLQLALPARCLLLRATSCQSRHSRSLPLDSEKVLLFIMKTCLGGFAWNGVQRGMFIGRPHFKKGAVHLDLDS
jgi:hypothetical protein